jgi:hypothetical protein
MKNIFLILLILFEGTYTFGQAGDYNTSLSCEINANAWSEAPIRMDARRAVVKVNLRGSSGGFVSGCTGTLINRNTSDDHVEYYVYLAKHCISGMPPDPDMSRTDHKIIFNYQSPTGVTSATPIPNRGNFELQSTNLGSTDFEYMWETKVTEVAKYFWGDFALIKIETPPPPYFNFYYQGWNPWFLSSSWVPSTSGIHEPYEVIHHPKGDIKKISGAHSITPLTNPIATGCRVVMKIIDWLFGWIWGRRIVMEVICNYIDNPWLVMAYAEGTDEEGSSGAGLLDPGTTLIGALSGSIGNCFITPVTFGKFRNNYNEATVRNALNPSHNWLIDNFGMHGRQVDCYHDINLIRDGYLFPANHYQSNNAITVNAQNTAGNGGQKLTAFSGSNYTFNAGKSVTFNPGVDIQSGAVFVSKIQTCAMHKEADELKQLMLEKLNANKLPQSKKFEIDEYLTPEQQKTHGTKGEINVYPNPTNTGNLHLSVSFYDEYINTLSINITNMLGQNIYHVSYDHEFETKRVEKQIDINAQVPGIYIITVKANDQTFVSKILRTE